MNTTQKPEIYIRVSRSEACADAHRLEVEEVDLGPYVWVEFVYEDLRVTRTENDDPEDIGQLSMRDGCWFIHGVPYSDLCIKIGPDPTTPTTTPPSKGDARP